MCPLQPCRLKQLIGPSPRAHIQPRGASRIRHLCHMRSGQPKPQIIFRQKNLGHFGKNLRFPPPHPGQLWGGKAREDDIAGQLAKDWIAIHHVSLSRSAGVVPQNTGAHHPILVIQQRRPMHVTGKTNGAHGAQIGLRGQGRQNRLCGLKPVLRRLL